MADVTLRPSRFTLFSTSLVCLLSIAVCGDTIARAEIVLVSGATMGTTYAVKLDDPDGRIDTATIQSAIDDRLERINDQMSTWRPDSELSRFNAVGNSDWFAVSPDVVRVVDAASDVSTLSGGAFDVTVGGLVNLWGFGPRGVGGATPTDAQIEGALARVGYRRLATRASPPALRKEDPHTYVDLSAIAKGFAVDEVARLLDAWQVPSYLVEIGGELRARGVKPDGSPWKVAIEQPRPGEWSLQGIVRLQDAAIATSGNYRNFLERDGGRYSHTIDPRTGRPVTHALASVSVIASSAMRADALATAIMVVGPDEGFRLARRENLAAQLILRSGDGFRVLATPPFERQRLR